MSQNASQMLESAIAKVREMVVELTKKYPLYE